MSAIVPVARTPITIRLATMSDYAFIDRLALMHSKALGFMPKAQLEGKIAAGHVLIAEERGRAGEGAAGREEQIPSPTHPLTPSPTLPLGYCMSQDRYFKRDDVGIVYQMNVAPGAQRKLVAATLLKAVFERAPYGCRLFCCWCRQDLDANYFWESMGFVPLAFRTGAAGKSTHIFWQRRIREGDVTTPYWFPAKTDGGMMREDRVVLPIPPGVHWKDEMPILLLDVAGTSRPCLEGKKAMAETAIRKEKTPTLMPPTRRQVQFGPPSDGPEPVVEKVKLGKPPKRKREKVKADPALIAKARELRDRWLEKVNSGQAGGLIPIEQGKYDPVVALPQRVEPALKALPVAA
jgi:hypothetical protein